jgi:hypothetical protein
LFTEFINDNKKTLIQILGPIDTSYDSELEYYEDDEENTNEFSQILDSKLDIEEIPECKYCIKKKYIQYNKKKKMFYWVKCPRCGGLGMDLEALEKYRFDLKY